VSARSGGHGPRSARVVQPRPFVRAAVFATVLAIAVVAGGQVDVLACPQCFGAEETTVIAGTRLGVLAMLAVTVVIQGAFVGFFLYLRKRARRIADIELDTEWSELQRASKPS
jgi:hypothetical protein